MLLILKFLAKIFSILNSEVSPKQIAAGFSFGILLGLIPAKTLLTLVLILVGFIVNINIPAMFLAAAIFKIISFLVDPLANQLGYFMLTQVSFLQGFWTIFYGAPVLPFFRLNNTIVVGSLMVGLVALIPFYFLTGNFVLNYRTRWKEKILKFKVVQIIKASSFYKYYLSYKGIKGE